MKDMQVHLDKLRAETAECEAISRRATDDEKRELFARLAEHYKVLTAEIERAIGEKRPASPPQFTTRPLR